MKGKKLFKWLFSICFFTLLIINSRVTNASAAPLINVTTNKDNIKAGDEFELQVNISNVQNLYGAALEFKYDNSTIKILDVNKGDIFNNLNTYSNKIDGTNGSNTFTCISTLVGNSSLGATQGNLFKIKAKAIRTGNTKIDIVDSNSSAVSSSNVGVIKLSDSSSNKISFDSVNYTFNVSNPLALMPGKYEENNPNIVYSGNWINAKYDKYYSGGALNYSINPGDSIEFSFLGTGFKWITATSVYRGIGTVFVDGQKYEVDNYTPSDEFQKNVFQLTNLNFGVHNVKIVLSSNRNPSSSTYCIALDAIEVLDNSSNNILKAGKYEDNNPNIYYVGNWQDNYFSKYSQGNLKFTTDVNDYLYFKFEGTGFKWATSTSPYRGIGQVIIDGKTYTADNYTSSDMFQKTVFTINNLPKGKHTVTIINSPNTNPYSTTNCIGVDYLEVFNYDHSAVAALGPGKYEEDNPNILYDGQWPSYTYSKYSGSLKCTVNVGDSFKFKFSGTGFKWVTSTSVYRGIAQVIIDGKTYTADNYTSSDMFQQTVFTIDNLPKGEHTVTVVNSPNTNPNSSTTCIGIDYIEVLNNDLSSVAALGPGKYEENNPNILYSGNWPSTTYYKYSGSLKCTVNVGDSFRFKFSGTGFKWVTSTSVYRGIAQVIIDGKTYTSDHYTRSDMFQQTVFTIDNLPKGEHTVTVVNSPNTNPNSSTTCIGIDYIEVFNNDLSSVAALGPGKHEENNPNILYSGNWPSTTYSKYSGSLKCTVNVGDSFRFKFSGTGFKWVTSTSVYRGIAQVIIDGKTYTSDHYTRSDMFQQTVFTIDNLPKGEHTVTVVNSPNTNPNSSTTCIGIDYIEVFNNDLSSVAALGPGKYEENNPNILYSGNWPSTTYSKYSGSLKCTVNVGDSFRFKFSGTGFKWVTSTSVYRGIAQVIIDGKTYTSDHYTSSDMFQRTVFTIDNLPKGEHTVTVVNSPNTNPNSSTTCIGIDYIEVFNNDLSSLAALAPGKHEENNPNILYSGSWPSTTYSKYSGSLKCTVNVGDSFRFKFSGTGFKWVTSTSVYRGIAQVIIDGKTYTSDHYTSSDMFQRTVFNINNLPNGEHTVTVINSPNTNPNSNTTCIGIDYLEVFN